jgi:periplasmic protein TonB
MDLQSNLIESKKKSGKGRWKAWPLASVGVHGLIIVLIVFMGATAVHKVDAEQKSIHAYLAQGAAPPPPPPPPPPAPSSAPKATPHPTIKPVQVPQHAFVQPTQTPKELPKVEVPTTPTPTVDTTPSLSSEPSSAEAGGVKGGVEGGVAGGVVGGVVGGQVGGELGGVLGGKVGGTGTGTEGQGKEAAPEPKPEGPLRVGGDVKAPVAVNKIEPNYTDVARKAHISGIVIVEAIIDEHGNVDHVKVIKGLPMGLSEEAVTAVKKWKFRPGTLNGEPVPVIFNLTVNFTLQ